MERQNPFFALAVLAVAIMVLVVLRAGPASSDSADSLDCYGCHQESCDVDAARIFVHQPFAIKQCEGCHLGAASAASGAGLQTVGAQAIEKVVMPDNVKWMGKSPSYASIHGFLFSGAGFEDTLYVQATDKGRKVYVEKVKLPKLEGLKQTKDDHAPPQIDELKVIEIKKGVFYSAKVGWKTNKIADAIVFYGTDNFSSVSPLNTSMTQEHEVTLTGLKANKTYQLKAGSTDLFGNKGESAILTLTTDKDYVAPPSEKGASGTGATKVALKSEFFRNTESYLLQVAADQMVTLSIGLVPASKEKASSKPNDHAPLKGSFETNISMCYTCHPAVKEALSHPVNVYPKQGMVIPPDYVVLPDGRITCTSCHSSHSSNIEFRLRKASKKDLCVGCHKDLA